jgi:DNA-binding response OmpR family regulator
MSPQSTIDCFRVLIVDDNVDSATCLRLLLSPQRYSVRMAHDGLAAVSVAAEFSPHIVLLDIGLPKLNGYEACRRIRALPGGESMVIFGITGWDDEEHQTRSEQAGFTQFLVKPVDLSTLEKLIESSLRT